MSATCDVCGAEVGYTWQCAADGCIREVCGSDACADYSGSDSEGTEALCRPCLAADHECEKCGRLLAPAQVEDAGPFCDKHDPVASYERSRDLWHHLKEGGDR